MSGNTSVPPLPAGYTLDQSAAPPPLPPGYTLDGQGGQGGEHGYAPAPPEPPAPPPSALSDLAGRMVQGTMPGLAIQGARAAYDAVTAPPAPPEKKTPWTEDNPALAAGDPREALPPSTVDWGKVGGAVREGWNGPVSLLPPGSDDAGQELLYGPYVGGAINTLFRFPLGLPNAILYGAAEFAHQATGDPRAAREVMRAAEMLPMHGSFGGPRPIAEPAIAPRVAPLMETFNRMDAARAAERAPPDRSWPLRIDDEPQPGTQAPAPPPEPPATAPAADYAGPPGQPPPGTAAPGPTPEPPPVPPREPPPIPAQAAEQPPAVPPPPVPEPPGPQSLGAAASRDMTDPAVLSAKTPAQALNDFATSVEQTQRDRSRPGVKENTIEDHNVYVPEVKRLESARVFDPEIAGNHDALMDIDPAYKAAVDKYEQENIHDVLKDKYQRMAGTDNTVDALKRQRQTVSPDALGVFKDERPVSGQPILDIINEIRDGPSGKSEAVTNTLNRIEKSLYDKNGNLEVLPSQYYGARRNLMEIRDSGPMTKEGAEARTARRELGRVGEVMDRVIGEGSNGYKDVYLPQWAHYSRLIDQQQYLQGKTIGAGKVTGADGNLTWNGMQKLLEQVLADKRKPGNSRAKTLTEDQLNNMVAIRNELAALKYRNDLAKSNGSPTVKKAAATARLGAPVMGMSPEAIDGVIHTLLAAKTGGLGNPIYQFGVKPWLERGRERKAQSIIEGMRNKLLSTEIPSE